MEKGIPDLVRAALEGRPGARTALYEHYYDRLEAVLRSKGARGADLEDVRQEVFLPMTKALDAGTVRPGRFEPWLFRVANNVWVDLQRRRARERGQPSEESAEEGRPDAHSRLDLRDAVEALPEIYRAPVLLAYRDGLSIHEIARHLQISYDTVKVRLHRARKILRRRMEGSP